MKPSSWSSAEPGRKARKINYEDPGFGNTLEIPLAMSLLAYTFDPASSRLQGKATSVLIMYCYSRKHTLVEKKTYIRPY
jgi:hypothetical protein